MRKQIEFSIERDSEPLTVCMRELTVREILHLSDALGEGSILDDVARIAPAVSNLTPEELMDLTPGELEMIWEQFKEVNASFFRIAEALGFGALLETMLLHIRECLVQAVPPTMPGEMMPGEMMPGEMASGEMMQGEMMPPRTGENNCCEA